MSLTIWHCNSPHYHFNMHPCIEVELQTGKNRESSTVQQ